VFATPYHPNAYLSSKRNVSTGLSARSKILSAIEARSSSAKEISGETGLNYRSVLYHLKLLEHEGIVARKGGRPYVWFTTGAGQLRLEQLIKESPH